MALRTQQIIGFESGAAQTDDPLGGSYYVEALTNQIEEDAYKLMLHIQNLGGAVSAIEQGFMQQEIADSAYQYQKDIDNQSKVIVGVNKFQETQNQASPPVFKIDESIRTSQIEKLQALKSERNSDNVSTCLANLSEAAKENRNVMPVILDAVENWCTLGEIADTFRNIYGEYKG